MINCEAGGIEQEGGTSTWDILHRYGQETRVVFVGDAKMGVAEIQAFNGSIMNNNEETGESGWTPIHLHIPSLCIGSTRTASILGLPRIHRPCQKHHAK